MQDLEKLGAFYLGRREDVPASPGPAVPILYDSSDLVTHALCVGMTGSGKTGLGIALIEEAAIDGVPVIVIDPKGDLTNLLLTFPDLKPEDFEPWVSEDDARRAGKSRIEFAAQEAERWSRGLADWNQDGARIRRLRDAAEFVVYTPGSTAGVPVSILTSLAPPGPAADDAELVSERIRTTVGSLLALAGIDADPVKSREHILLSSILQAAWRQGEQLDFPTLVQRIHQPPMTRVGVIDVDSFFPPKDRFDFSMAINALATAPGFEVWTEGVPLDVGAFLRSGSGKPRISIFSIAHLDDSHRMFFVAQLLNAITGWMRAQSGTTSLRALVYMDEIFGYFPPVANPPSKLPMLTLLKQGRAFGIGVVLCTQNPVDLDYKGLSNIGTWWLGRLQTDRDKARVLDGLEQANAAGADRAEIDRQLSRLTSRVFLMRNVHEDGLTLMRSRWCLSYLRGPLGRDDVKRLMQGRTAALLAGAPGAMAAATAPTAPRAPESPAARPASDQVSTARPILPPDVPQYFAPALDGRAGLTAVAPSALRRVSPEPWRRRKPRPYNPVIYGAVAIRFTDTKLGVDESTEVAFAAPVTDNALPVDWEQATRLDLSPDALEAVPPEGATFEPVPAAATKATNYQAWSKQLQTWVASNETVELFKSPSTGLVGRPGEIERDFRARVQQAARERRDQAVEALRRKYAPKQAGLDEKLRRAKVAADRETEQASSSNLQSAISIGATLVSAFLGRKALSASTIGKATTAARGVGRSMKEAGDIGRARETIAAVEEQQQALDDELRAETAAIDAANDVLTEALSRVVVKPKKTQVAVKLVALVWM